MPRFIVFVVIVALAGCSEQAGPGSPAPGPSAVSSVAPADDPPGLLTCRQLADAIRSASLMQPGIVQAIVAASTTADAPVADAASALGQAYEKALTSQGTRSEPDAVAAVSAAAADMSQVCADSGLDSAN